MLACLYVCVCVVVVVVVVLVLVLGVGVAAVFVIVAMADIIFVGVLVVPIVRLSAAHDAATVAAFGGGCCGGVVFWLFVSPVLGSM